MLSFTKNYHFKNKLSKVQVFIKSQKKSKKNIKGLTLKDPNKLKI
jgi:hypothetical protein